MNGQGPDTAAAIDALLPQTQCRKCGYAGCRPYAEAIAAGEAAINRCPPGGEATLQAIADLLQVPATELDPACGTPGPRLLAVIEEAHCIGCTLCLAACPVDAIVGAAKLMHTVIAGQCTGCELCLPPCPVDCITLVARDPQPDVATLGREADEAQRRHAARMLRLAREKQAAQRVREQHAAETRKRDTVARALARARERLGARGR